MSSKDAVKSVGAAATPLSLSAGLVRSKNTRPEMLVRRGLHARGLRYRVHVRSLPGTPDIVLPRHGVVVFVHGCFWHQHLNCKKAALPATRTEFWAAKLRRNVERDAEHVRRLERAGWRVVVVWECELKDTDRLVDRLERYIRGPQRSGHQET